MTIGNFTSRNADGDSMITNRAGRSIYSIVLSQAPLDSSFSQSLSFLSLPRTAPARFRFESPRTGPIGAMSPVNRSTSASSPYKTATR